MIHGFLRERMPRLGKIHLGEKAISPKSGKEYPKDTDYFKVPPEVAEVYKTDTPKELTIMVPSIDVNQFFPYSLKRYANDKLICRGDGLQATCFNHETGEWVEKQCQYQDCEYYKDNKCTEVGNLMVLLPDVSIWGVYQIDTGSWHGINNIYNAFNSFLQRLTDITGTPDAILRVKFKLVRQEQQLEFTDKGVRKTSTKAILNLIPPPLNYDSALLLADHFQRGGALPNPYRPTSQSLPPVPDEEPLYSAEIKTGALLPDPDEAPMPKDLYPGETPLGPNMGQRAAWAALLETVQELGKSVEAVERSVLKLVSPTATTFTDLTGAEEAPDALARLTHMIENWQKEATVSPSEARNGNGNGQKTAPATSAVQAPAAMTEQPTIEGSFEF